MSSPFFILATARSGTTLLEQCLNRHTQLFVPPETYFFNQLQKNSTETAEQLQAFVDEYLASPQASFIASHPQIISERLLKQADDAGMVFENMMSLLMKQAGQGKKIWGEKTPMHLFHAESILSLFPDAKFIFLVRDGRAVVNSQMQHPNWHHSIFFSCQKLGERTKRNCQIDS